MDIVDSVGIGVDEEIPPSLTSTVRDCCTVQVGRRVFRTMNAIKCVCVIVSEKVDGTVTVQETIIANGIGINNHAQLIIVRVVVSWTFLTIIKFMSEPVFHFTQISAVSTPAFLRVFDVRDRQHIGTTALALIFDFVVQCRCSAVTAGVIGRRCSQISAGHASHIWTLTTLVVADCRLEPRIVALFQILLRLWTNPDVPHHRQTVLLLFCALKAVGRRVRWTLRAIRV